MGQAASDGGLEPVSYFTNPSASHSVGKTAKSAGISTLQSELLVDDRCLKSSVNNFLKATV